MDSQNKIKISVIIPVYNVAPYIGRCIDSFKSQTLRELEFVFVDDCGTDQSMRIVEEFAAADNRARIIRNEQNIGSGPSRNIGIEAAQGDYLSFIDPDDYISSDFFALLYNAAQKTNSAVAKGSVIKVASEKKPAESLLNDAIRKSLQNDAPLYTFFFEHSSAIYRKSLFDDGMVRYGTYRHSQDMVFLFRASLKAASMTIEDKAKYYYVLREGSATTNHTARRFFEDLGSLEEIIETKERIVVEDPYVIPYISSRISRRMTSFSAAADEDEAVASREEEYIKRLQSILGQLSDLSLLTKRLPEVGILMDYNRLIPTGEAVTTVGVLKRWSSFLQRYPLAAETYRHRYSEIIWKTLCDRTTPILGKAGWHSRVSLVWQQLGSLDAITRRMIVRSLPGSFLSLVRKRFRAGK